MRKAIALAVGLSVGGGALLIDAPAFAGKGATTNAQGFFQNDGKRSQASQTPRRMRTPRSQQQAR